MAKRREGIMPPVSSFHLSQSSSHCILYPAVSNGGALTKADYSLASSLAGHPNYPMTLSKFSLFGGLSATLASAEIHQLQLPESITSATVPGPGQRKI